MHHSICWLCGQESEIIRYWRSLNPRAALYRLITLSGEGVNHANISRIYSRPISFLPRYTARKRCYDTVPSPAYSHATHRWTFRVHVDCWDLVSSRVSDPTVLATNWCRALITMNWKYTYLGLLPTHSNSPRLLLSQISPDKKTKNYRRLSLEILESFDGLQVELRLPQLPTNRLPIPLDQLGLSTLNQVALSSISNCNDPFSGLPQALLQQIIQSLPTSDLLNLRLASKPMAQVSTLDALPRSFWLSRFTPPFEMGFALPARFDQNLDWRGLYFLIRNACKVYGRTTSNPAQRNGSSVARLAKRKYWWERLEGVVELCGRQKPRGTVIKMAHDSILDSTKGESRQTATSVRPGLTVTNPDS
ncbi:hypothetical protein QBC44DRAFT_234261 [Cladorrhinum sp. PSN332]|nr:hypothetical protein QBC44DRAFT_234261 [Cladorrhinum sp. PSN332]